MRYWNPFPHETVGELLEQGVRQFLVVPTYPQYSGATSGTTLQAICTTIRRWAPHFPLHVIPHWHLLPGYLTAVAQEAGPILERWCEAEHSASECGLLYTAHALPERFIQRGDPYLQQVGASVAAIHHLLATRLARWGEWWHRLAGGGQPLLAFQSKVGPVRWLSPSLPDETRRLANQGCRRLLVLPISFTCEHIETLYELDIELAQIADQSGISEFQRGAALNLDKGWLASMAEYLKVSAFGRRAAANNTSLVDPDHG
jgi:ferrochelatase